jgi:hypothetical protein
MLQEALRQRPRFATLNQAIIAVDAPSREFVYVNGLRTPVSQYFGYTIYKSFGYELPAPNDYPPPRPTLSSPTARFLDKPSHPSTERPGLR